MENKQCSLTIGTLSLQAGVNIETIRYYERSGLMPAPPRTEGGHRLYCYEHLKRLVFIRRSRELGFSMAEIQELLRLVDGDNYTCRNIKAITEQHLQSIREKITDLRRVEKALEALSESCEGDLAIDCPILETLLNSAPPRDNGFS